MRACAYGPDLANFRIMNPISVGNPLPTPSLLDDPKVFFRCVESSNDTVMITDTRGVMHYVNNAWQTVYGYRKEEAIGQTPALIRSHRQDQAFYERMWAQILDPAVGYWKGELLNRSKNGKEVPVFLTITPIKDEKGAVTGYMGIAVDITDKKRMEAQIVHQDRLASIGLIAAGLAHEIGNPLGVVRGRAEYLSLLISDNEAAKSNLDIVVKQIDRISKLIYSLLHLARGTQSETIRPVEVLPIVEEVFELLSKKIEQGNISLENRVSKEVVVAAEPVRLEQVILNLGINAIQAIESAIREGRRDNHHLEISAEDRGDAWEILIQDTGCGIPEENLPEIFKPFFSTKDCGVGTGLGLPISEQIIRGWNGAIEVETKTNEGTTFKILLPKR